MRLFKYFIHYSKIPKNSKKIVYVILFLAIILRLCLILILPYKPEFDFQQEHYYEYISAINNNTLNTIYFSDFEKRLFPGYILSIIIINPVFNNMIASGIFISLISFVISFFILFKLINKKLPLLFYSFFPPFWIITNVKSATETITSTILLASVYIFLRNNFFFAGLTTGIAFNYRAISICLLITFLIFLLLKKQFKNLLNLFLGFFITSSMLLLYNFYFFGKDNLFIQFNDLDEKYGIKIGFLQIFLDIQRAISWGQYRILISGLFYITVSFITLIVLFKLRKKSKLYFILFMWVLLSILFIFTFSPFTLIENYFRYILIFTPAIAIAFSEITYKIFNHIKSSVN